MIKTPIDREDISQIIDSWEHYIEDVLDKHWTGQYAYHIALPISETLTEEVIEELQQRYKQAGWWIWFYQSNHWVVGLKTLSTQEAETKRLQDQKGGRD